MTFKQHCFYSILFVTWPSLLWGSEAQNEQDFYRLCPVDSEVYRYVAPPVFADEDVEETLISAEEVKNTAKSSSIFSGNVIIERHLLRLSADQVIHDSNAQRLELDGNVHADTADMSLNAESGWFNLDDNSGQLIGSEFFLPNSHLSGKAPLFSFTEGDKTVLLNTQFSSCPPNKPDWYLDTSWLELNQKTATGTAKHAVLWVEDIPVFYIPWIQFPLGEERRSGFLMPFMGTSNKNGFEVGTPWYWNIAPNQDAIITPSNLSFRGQMLTTNYRYLTASSQGTLDAEYLQKDDKLDGLERYLISFKNSTQLSNSINLSLLANNASDTDYLDDFGSNIAISNTTHLERNARLSYQYEIWNAGLMAQTFQTIDSDIAKANRPYRRLPQLTLKGSDALFEFSDSYLLGTFDAEWVAFKHEDDNRVQGNRLHANPRISLPLQSNAWYLTPSLGMFHTEYDLDEEGTDIEKRDLTSFSLDGGLFFERALSDSSIIQTLEPRLYYLNVPFEDQSAIPLFDTSAQNFSFSSLFRENRFNGIDRIGDAKQITLALSTRFLDKSNGHELFNLNIGRIYYFDQQRVFLNSITTPVAADTSDIIMELNSNMDNWRTRATFQWNTEDTRSDKRSVQLSYAASEKAVFNIGYRFFRNLDNEDNNIEQTDLSFALPIGSRYSLLSRWNYSLTEERDLDTIFGIEYESCCWALRLVSQRYVRGDENTHPEYNNSIMLQFVLKGFGSISDREATNTLKNAILGYQPDY